MLNYQRVTHTNIWDHHGIYWEYRGMTSKIMEYPLNLWSSSWDQSGLHQPVVSFETPNSLLVSRLSRNDSTTFFTTLHQVVGSVGSSQPFTAGETLKRRGQVHVFVLMPQSSSGFNVPMQGLQYSPIIYIYIILYYIIYILLYILYYIYIYYIIYIL